MARFLRLLSLCLVLGLGAGIVWWRRAEQPLYFCAEAATPAAYEGEWFYRLHEGPDGWLFRDDDLAQSFELHPKTLSYLSRLNDTLAARGVTLILAAQPPRGVALASGSVPGYDSEAVLTQYEAFREALTKRGLHVTNLEAVVAETPDYFFKRDHHWTPEGAKRSAAAVAETLKATPAYETTGSERRAFQTFAVRQEAQLGSFGEAIGHICGKNPPAERLTRFQTEPEDAPEGTLFGETPAPPIALVGTSNSARKDLNFAGFLEAASRLGVLNASAVGGGAEAALEAFLRSETFAEATPTFLVWEFATLFDIPQNPVFYRQLLPSLAGVCSVQKSTASLTKSLKERTTLLATAPDGPTRYLYLEFDDLSQKTFDLELSYRDAATETLTIRRSSREVNDGRFFLELLGEVSRVTLILPDEASGAVQARFCP